MVPLGLSTLPCPALSLPSASAPRLPPLQPWCRPGVVSYRRFAGGPIILPFTAASVMNRWAQVYDSMTTDVRWGGWALYAALLLSLLLRGALPCLECSGAGSCLWQASSLLSCRCPCPLPLPLARPLPLPPPPCRPLSLLPRHCRLPLTPACLLPHCHCLPCLLQGLQPCGRPLLPQPDCGQEQHPQLLSGSQQQRTHPCEPPICCVCVCVCVCSSAGSLGAGPGPAMRCLPACLPASTSERHHTELHTHRTSTAAAPHHP